MKVPDMGRQLLRSGTSVGAQYSEATRAQSNPDCISKIGGPFQELEETDYFPFITGQNSKGQANALPYKTAHRINRGPKDGRRSRAKGPHRDAMNDLDDFKPLLEALHTLQLV